MRDMNAQYGEQSTASYDTENRKDGANTSLTSPSERLEIGQN